MRWGRLATVSRAFSEPVRRIVVGMPDKAIPQIEGAAGGLGDA
jgi:hypothetical protein